MENAKEENNIITLESVSKLEQVLEENSLAIVSVQIEFYKNTDPPEQGGDGNG
ncbi:MAG: hypothetical protein J5783_08165 [Lachnospiraceae bacterium]|nr:hypothetical protein [Lachnospiraceae bacterium]